MRRRRPFAIRHFGPFVWLAAMLFLVVAIPSEAQIAASFAQVNGIVNDPNGARAPQATVTLRALETNQVYAAHANGDGFYVFANVTPGGYEIRVESPGFAVYTQAGIVLRVGQAATIDVTLKIDSQSERVLVTGELPLVEPGRTEVSQLIEARQISSLPISGRLFTDFVLLSPGVAAGRTSLQSTITEFEVTRVSFGGMRDLSNEVTVDGADTVNTVTGSQRATPSQDAVSEFRVLNSSFGADNGRALGGVVNIVTKSGTNSLHGALYEYLQNNATDARSLLAPEFHTLRQNQYGATLGGPVRRDKTFFFLNFEGQRRAESPTYPGQLVNDLGLINAAKTALGLAPERLDILKTNDSDKGIVKVDQTIGERHRLSFRYNVEDGRALNQLVGNTMDGGGVAAPSAGHNSFVRDQSLVATVTSVLSPTMVNSALFQYGRRHYDFPGVTGQPNLDIPNSLLLGHHFGVFDFIGESRQQFSDSVSWTKGSHLVKLGFDSNFLEDKVTWPGFTPMRIILPGVNCLVQFADFVNPAAHLQENQADGPCPLPPVLNGTPLVMWDAPVGAGPFIQGSLPQRLPTDWSHAYLPSLTEDFNVHLNHSYHALFVQDQWRVAPKLSISAGLRWDVEKGLEKVIHPDYRNVAPRFGIAYSPDGKTVIRAGFGMFFDRYNLSFVFVTYPERTVQIPGVQLPGERQGSQTAGVVFNELAPGPAGMPADAARNLILTGQLPPTYNQGPCPPNCTAGAGLVDPNSRTSYSEQSSFGIDREIRTGLALSAGYLFVAAHHLVRAEDLNVAPPVGKLPDGKDVFGAARYPSGLLYYTDNSGNSVYHGMTLQLRHRYSRHLDWSANYTFAKTLDDGTFTTFVSTPQDLYLRNLERANSNQDVRHRFTANFVATAPEKGWLRNFELSGIVVAQSPRPFTLFAGFDVNNDGNPVTDRVGLSARNTYWGDSQRSVDIRVSRFFRIAERARLHLSADGFNVLNRANVEEVNTVYGAPDFIGGIPRHYKDGTGSPASPLFGAPRVMLNPRQLQFAVKVEF
ncbi:MAG TPA: TonB-dependent receptor [Candidatus Acidoferrales bacterium]|nr:TonB-dependent receptor [Candidatus Acidoferrales bacterium]